MTTKIKHCLKGSWRTYFGSFPCIEAQERMIWNNRRIWVDDLFLRAYSSNWRGIFSNKLDINIKINSQKLNFVHIYCRCLGYSVFYNSRVRVSRRTTSENLENLINKRLSMNAWLYSLASLISFRLLISIWGGQAIAETLVLTLTPSETLFGKDLRLIIREFI